MLAKSEEIRSFVLGLLGTYKDAYNAELVKDAVDYSYLDYLLTCSNVCRSIADFIGD